MTQQRINPEIKAILDRIKGRKKISPRVTYTTKDMEKAKSILHNILENESPLGNLISIKVIPEER